MASLRAPRLRRRDLMTDSTLDIMRREAIQTRLKGIAGGTRILWSAQHAAQIRSYVGSLPEKETFRSGRGKTVITRLGGRRVGEVPYVARDGHQRIGLDVPN